MPSLAHTKLPNGLKRLARHPHKIRRVAEAFFARQWAILPEKLDEIQALIVARMQGEKFSPEEIRARIGDAADEQREYDVRDGVAVIPVYGVIEQRMSLYSDISGGTSTEEIVKDLNAAAGDPEVTEVVFDVESPGGSVNGLEELVAAIARFPKPTTALANELMASAAYWIAAACDQILVKPSAIVGSIGVLQVHQEQSKAEAKFGIKTTIVKAGQFKAAGNPHEPLDEDSRGVIQEKVDAYYSLFVESVARSRGLSVDFVRDKMANGKTYVGRVAVDQRFADGVVESLDALISRLAAQHSGAAENPTRSEGTKMTKRMRRFCLKAGMPEKLNGFAAQQWLGKNFALVAKLLAEDDKNPVGEDDDEMAEEDETAEEEEADDDETAEEEEAEEDETAEDNDETTIKIAKSRKSANAGGKKPRAQTGKRRRISGRQVAVEIMAMCEAIWPNNPALAQKKARHYIDAGYSLERATRMATKTKSKTNRPIGNVAMGDSQFDKVMAGASDGLALRTLGQNAGQLIDTGRPGAGRWELAPFEAAQARDRDGLPVGPRTRQWSTSGRKLHPAATEFSRMRLVDVAKACLAAVGVSTRGMVDQDVAAMALAWENQGLPRAANGGYASGGEVHTSGTFPGLLLDAVNKTLLMGYTESPATWRQWCRVGEDARDYKDINRVRLGEASDLEVIPEGDPFPQDRMGETREYYAVETRGKAFSFTRQMLVNDDLDALSVIPMRAGIAAERTINRAVYAVLTGNPTLTQDGKALFHADHNNIVSSPSPAAPTVAQLNAMQLLLRTQAGVSSQTILNTLMAYLIIPAALEGATKQLLRSTADPAGSHEGVANIWQGFNGLIVEGQLDGASAVQYYGAARWQEVDTVEVTFLMGERAPVVEQEIDFDTKGRKFTIHQTFGVHPIDYKGLVQNPGQ